MTRLKWKAESDAFPDKKLERRYMIAGAPRPYPFGLVAETSSCAKPPAVRPSSVEAGPAAAAPVSAVSSLRLFPPLSALFPETLLSPFEINRMNQSGDNLDDRRGASGGVTAMCSTSIYLNVWNQDRGWE